MKKEKKLFNIELSFKVGGSKAHDIFSPPPFRRRNNCVATFDVYVVMGKDIKIFGQVDA